MKTTATTIATIFSLFFASALSCLATSYVKFGDIEGGLTDPPERAGWSKLKSYKGGIKRGSNVSVEQKETKIKKCADSASAALATKLATRDIIDEVKLVFERMNPDTGDPEVYLTIILCEVAITGIDTELP